jgi:hypothetical protein
MKYINFTRFPDVIQNQNEQHDTAETQVAEFYSSLSKKLLKVTEIL